MMRPFAVASLMVIVILSVTGCSSSTPPPELKASVRFTGTQFEITNDDDVDWLDVQLTVNDNYALKPGRIDARSQVKIGAMQFAKADGVRFNPFTMKPQRFRIMAYQSGSDSRSMYVASFK